MLLSVTFLVYLVQSVDHHDVEGMRRRGLAGGALEDFGTEEQGARALPTPRHFPTADPCRS